MINQVNARLVGVLILCRRSDITILVGIHIIVCVLILLDALCELTLDKYRYLEQCY